MFLLRNSFWPTTECLTMYHKVTIWPELPIANWVSYLTQQAIKLGVHSCISSSNGIVTYVIGYKQAPRAQGSYINKWSRCHSSPFLSRNILSPSPHLRGLMRSSLWSVHRGRENLGLIYRWFCTLCMHHQKANSFSTANLLWDILERYRWREIFLLRTSSNIPGRSLCSEEKVSRCVIIY